MNYTKPIALRFNYEKDKELLSYLKINGYKKGIKTLFEFYNQHNNVINLEQLLDEKLNYFFKNFKPTETKEMDNVSQNFMSGLKKLVK